MGHTAVRSNCGVGRTAVGEQSHRQADNDRFDDGFQQRSPGGHRERRIHREGSLVTLPPPLHVVHGTEGVDPVAAEEAARRFLQALGIRTDTESTRGTPGRTARAYAELFSTGPFDLTTFPNDEGYDELVLARSIPVRSVCEHNLLPFVGTAHVGYLPGRRIPGLSKLARVVEHFACRPQVQERLTKQIADWLQLQLEPKGVGVVIEAEHTCMTLRGVQATGSTTVTSTLLGLLRRDQRSRGEFLALTRIAS